MVPQDILSFALPTLAATFGVGRTEAEDLDIKEGFKVQSNGAASGGAMLQATAPQSEVTGLFDGAAGTYDLTIGYFDETDGASSMDVLVNGSLVDSFGWDATDGSAIANGTSAAERVVVSLDLSPGDVVTLKGNQDGGEPLRTDYIELTAATAPPPPPVPGAFEVEAEDLTIVSGYKVVSNGAASGEAMLQSTSLVDDDEPLATYTVAQTGVFDITISYFDETDGASNMAVLLNDVGIDFFVWDGTDGSPIANAASLTTRTIEGVALSAGDVIGLQGFGEGGEPARIDKLSFEPAMAPPPPPPVTSFVVEAEDLTIVDGFKVVSNGAASGGETLQDNFETTGGGAPVEARASYTVTDTGLFNLTLGVFDENDGVSSLRILLNGLEVNTFQLDSASGSAIANGASAVALDAGLFNLVAGDVIEIAGFGDGGEPLRVDFLQFDAATFPPPPVLQTPDIWYEDAGEVIVATNDGFANFTEVPTGIIVGDADIFSGDFDGDGDIDFLTIEAVGNPIMTADPAVEEQEIAISLFLNDGNAVFAAQPTQTVFSDIAAGTIGTGLFSGLDVGDIDDDGNLDILGRISFENPDFFTDDGFLLTFENNGIGGFSAMETTPNREFGFLEDARLADVNGDGNQDVFVFNSLPDSNVDVYINDGTGAFAFLAEDYLSDNAYFDQQILDIDSDGDLDALFSTNDNSRAIRAYINDGTGAPEEDTLPGVFGDEDGLIGVSVAADFDRDGKIEVVSAGIFDDDGVAAGLQVFDVVTTGTDVSFDLKSVDNAIVGNVQAFGDFDLDGDLDILMSEPSEFFFEVADFQKRDPGLSLLENDGFGNFTDKGVVVPPFNTVSFGSNESVNVDFFDDLLV